MSYLATHCLYEVCNYVSVGFKDRTMPSKSYEEKSTLPVEGNGYGVRLHLIRCNY